VAGYTRKVNPSSW